MFIKSITINHATKQIVLTRVLNYTDTGLITFIIPDEIDGNCVELQDPVQGGSSLLYPFNAVYPNDLNLYKGQIFKLQLHDCSQITGELVEYTNKCIVVDVQIFSTSEASKNKTLPKGKLSISEDLIAAYFPRSDELIKDRLTKIVLSNTTTPRDITVTYSIPIAENISLGHFTHTIKGIHKKQLYTNPNLDTDIPITINTEYNWMPLWNTFEEGIITTNTSAGEAKPTTTVSSPPDEEVCAVQLNIISETKQKYTIENFVGFKHYLNKIPISLLYTKCTRAVLVHPVGPIQIALYFKNNSSINLIKSQIILVDQEDIDQFGSANNNNSNNNRSEQQRIFGKPQPVQPLMKSRQPFALPQIGSSGSFTEPTFSFLKEVKSGEIGIISFSIPNDQIQIYKDVAHQPLWETKSKEFNVGEIKISNIFTLLDAHTLNKINYRFVNATPYNTNFIVYVGSKQKTTTPVSLTTEAPAPAFEAVTTTTPGTEFENKSSITVKSIGNNDECEMIGESLYLFNSPSLSINTFEMSYSTKKQFMTNSRLPQVLINYLNERGITIRYNPDKFETYDLSHFDRITQDTILKLMGSLHLEERTSNYFAKSYPAGDISSFLFDEQSGFQSSFGKSGLFGSSNYNYQQQAQLKQQQQLQPPQQQLGRIVQPSSNVFTFGTAVAENNNVPSSFGKPQQPQQPQSNPFYGTPPSSPPL